MPEREAAIDEDDRAFGPQEFLLYAVTVGSWSASWYALKVNSATFVAPPVSTTWRFVLAAAIMFAWVALARGRLRFGAREHLLFAGLGVFLFSTNFVLFYYASTALVSGLLAVVFSLASIVNLALGALRGERRGAGRWLGAALGACGIALLYAPEIARGEAALWALGLCVAGTVSFCIGNLVSQRSQSDGVPVLSASAWGMAYGAGWSAVLALGVGAEFTFDPRLPYVASLLFLVVVSTILAFWAYLNLIGRIGPGRAAYATVMFPVFALLLSTMIEGYEWTFAAAAGVVLALAGNVFVLRGRTRARPASIARSEAQT